MAELKIKEKFNLYLCLKNIVFGRIKNILYLGF